MERKVLQMALNSADDKIVAANLGISVKEVATYKTRVRRKIAKAKKFLEEVKKYNRALFPEPRYKGI
jgi:DNA-binding CsgD family transcriptional regulator